MENSKEVMSEKEAAEFLGVKPRTLTRWRKDGTGPAHCVMGPRFVRYTRDDLIEFVKQGAA